MSAWSARSVRTRALILGGAGLVVIAVAYLGWQVSRPVPVPVLTEAAALAVVPVDVVPQTPETGAAPEAGAVAEPAVDLPLVVAEPAAAEPPSFDIWRVAPDGEAVVSGRAVPGSRVTVLVDGASVAEVDTSAQGEFAALFTMPPNAKPSLMTLTMAPPEGASVVSEEMVALGAIKGPEVIAPAPAAEMALATEPTATETPDSGAAGAAPPAAPVPPPAILLTGDGAVVLQSDTPSDPGTAVAVSVGTISYAPGGAVQLGGRGTADAEVRIYLDNRLQQSVTIAANGQWLATLGDTPPGIYTLRVDQVDGSGKVTSRFETPFKRETPEALAAVVEAPVIVAPAAPVQDPMAAEVVEPTEAAATPEATPEPAPGAEPAPPVQPAGEPLVTAGPPPPVTITVQPGFTLWGIAQESYGEGVMYVQVFEANRDKIRDPDLIYPGQVFSMPEGD